MPNKLAGEHSPYLLKHAHNPVDWMPWGDEAFELARRLDKPVFLSIGYTTCHWCNVMEEESFSDAEAAAALNEAFVCVKVDREERPDVDHVYMAVCQMTTGSGGWPLTVILEPQSRSAFFAGTYFPKSSRGGRIGVMELSERVSYLWKNSRAELLDSASKITEALSERTGGSAGKRPDAWDAASSAYEELKAGFDAEHGGFGPAPKFPTPHVLMMMLRMHRRDKRMHPALVMATHTLVRMRRGGIYDHLAGGFHRYSTDGRWLLPHFEKMLYDQALLAMAYTEAFAISGNAEYEATARGVLDFVLAELRSPEGGFYTALSADSEGREGAHYVWREAEIADAVGPERAALIAKRFNVKSEGNFIDPMHGSATGENVLHLDALAEIKEDEATAEAASALWAARQKRERPELDDKIMADTNGLMIAAMAIAGRALGEARYIDAAREAAEFVERELGSGDLLMHRWRRGNAGVDGNADDYAFICWGMIELYEATFEPRYLTRALELMERLHEGFISDSGAYYFTREAAGGPASGHLAASGPSSGGLPVRRVEVYDGAVPSANSVALNNLARLARLTGRRDLDERGRGLADALWQRAGAAPWGHAHYVSGLLLADGPVYEVTVVGRRGEADTEEMIGELQVAYLPDCVLHFKEEGSRALDDAAPYTAPYTMRNGRATAYVCRDGACMDPVTGVEALYEALGVRRPHAH